MAIDNIFGIASAAMNAQLVRMNTTASEILPMLFGTVAGERSESI